MKFSSPSPKQNTGLVAVVITQSGINVTNTSRNPKTQLVISFLQSSGWIVEVYRGDGFFVLVTNPSDKDNLAKEIRQAFN